MKKVHWGVLGTAGIARSQTIPGMQMTETASCTALPDGIRKKSAHLRKPLALKGLRSL